MTKLKVSFLAVAAILLGICGSAFTTVEKSARVTPAGDSWFTYNGGTNTDPANYTYVGTSAPCSASSTYCAMKGFRQASPNQNRPTQQSLDDAASASGNFAIPVDELVHFKP